MGSSEMGSSGFAVADGAPVTGAMAVMHMARKLGIEVVFANPGTTEMWLVHALDHTEGMRGVLCLHETVCTGAADGWARMRGLPAMTLLHLGPGLANGLANLHNARRAGSRIVNLVGDMATWHGDADPLLGSDIAALARTVSKVVRTSKSAMQLASDLADCVAETAAADRMGGSRIATLLVPHDCSWEELPPVAMPAPAPCLSQVMEGTHTFMAQCAAAMKMAGPKCALLLGGGALLQDGGALEAAGKIAASTGAHLLGENAFARIDRGMGLPRVKRLPYFPDAAEEELRKFEQLVVVGTRLPVAMFGYKDGPSQLAQLPEERVWHLDVPGLHCGQLLQALASAVGVEHIAPGCNCRGVFITQERRPKLPTGKLTGAAVCAVVAALQPAGCVLVDESITAGAAYWDLSERCPAFSHLTLTGGAIGCGPPLSLGSSLACPDRRIINLQADGSAMYSFQALWSQAREKCNVITVVLANQTYQILKVEQMKQRIPATGKASLSLTKIDDPALDFVALAAGCGVQGERVTTAEEMAAALRRALARDTGPYLIEAAISS